MNFEIKKQPAEIAETYIRMAALFEEQEQPKQAGEYYFKAIQIYEELSFEKAEKYSGDLARTYLNFAFAVGEHAYFKKAYDLAKKYPHNPHCRKMATEIDALFTQIQ